MTGERRVSCRVSGCTSGRDGQPWTWTFPADVALRGLLAHYDDTHGEQPATLPQLDGVTWQEQFLSAVRALPVGAEFTVADLHRDLPTPPHVNCWGAAMTVAAHMGLARAVTTQRSELPTTKGSRLLRWQRVDERSVAA